jgi:hypothetical protein
MLMKKWLKNHFKPDQICSGVDQIDYKALFKTGKRLILLDIDNTLAIHGSKHADDFARKAVSDMHSEGFRIIILSNAKRKRARMFADSIGLEAEGMARKPSPRVLLAVCRKSGIDVSEVCMIGDQIFTDIWAAKRAGTYAILVRPRSDQESPHIRLKRLVENLILNIVWP